MKRKQKFWQRLLVALLTIGGLLALPLWLARSEAQPVVAMAYDDHDEGDHAELDSKIVKLMQSAPYRHGTWGLLEVNPANGRVIHALAADHFFVPGSVTKLFSVSAALDTLGFDHRFTTPVYALGSRDGATLNGNLVLVAQGDLALGGRAKADGTLDYTAIDHTVANIGLPATLTPQDPLAGIAQLAQQVRAAGITQVNGTVIIDTRLFLPDPYLIGTPDPISINDNLIDVVITPGAVGGPANVQWRPQVAPYHLELQATTVAAGQPTTVGVQTFPDGRVLVSGAIAADAGQQVRVGAISDSAAFARTALIEALGRAGVTVSASVTGTNPIEQLPTDQTYSGATWVAAYVSPPFQEYAKLILKVSHSVGANLMLCLLAVQTGSSDCEAGFPVLAAFLDRAQVDRAQVALADGRGEDPVNHVTPQATVDLLRYWLTRPEAATFRQMLPVLGVDGGLASVCTDCPAKGKVFAKTGLVLRGDSLNYRFIQDQAYAGYLEAKPGQFFAFALFVNGAFVPPEIPSALKVYDEVGMLAALLQQEAAGDRKK